MFRLWIREMRQKQGLSQIELADKLQVNQTAVSQWERGAAYPSCDKIPALANALGCTIDELFGCERAGRDSA